MASSFTSYQTVPASTPSLDYLVYPHPLGTYEEVIASPQRFRETLEKLHAYMRTKFKIPTVGGRELDLHRLFVEVTSRGGFMRVLQEKKWREVTNVFNFPSSATNASFILRKYYTSLLRHYEQVYFFKSKGWSPGTFGTLQTVSVDHSPPDVSTSPVMSTPAVQPVIRLVQMDSSPQGASLSSPLAGSAVHGVIDGKFERGYLITVKVGSDLCKGILYERLSDIPHQMQPHEVIQQNRTIPANESSSSALASRVVRRRRRKKSEIRRRDPDHPKSNRSGYNFFFAEQHARLKPLYPGKDREISRMIGESWNNLNESERAVYQEKAARDKERYIIEMEGYRQRLRIVQNGSNPAPTQQQPIQITEAIPSQAVKGGDFIDQNGKGKLDVVMMETPAADVIPVQTQPLVSDVNTMNLDKTVLSDHGNSLMIENTAADVIPVQTQPLVSDDNTMSLDKTAQSDHGNSLMMETTAADVILGQTQPLVSDDNTMNLDKTAQSDHGNSLMMEATVANVILVQTQPLVADDNMMNLDKTVQSDHENSFMMETPAADVIPVQMQPLVSDVNTMNLDKTVQSDHGNSLMTETAAADVIPVQTQPLVSDDNMMNLDKTVQFDLGNSLTMETAAAKVIPVQTQPLVSDDNMMNLDKTVQSDHEMMMETPAADAIPVQTQPLVSDDNMMNLDKTNSLSADEDEISSNTSKNGYLCFSTLMPTTGLTQLPKTLQPLELHGKIMDQERSTNNGDERHIMPVIDVEMTDQVEKPKSEDGPHNPENETDNNKAAEDNGDKTSEEAKGGTKNAADGICVGGIELGLHKKTKEADEAEDYAGEVAKCMA